MKNISQHQNTLSRSNFLFALVILCTTFVFTFSEIIAWVIKSWFTSQHSYGILIFALSIYMIWIQRHRLLQLPVRPNIFFGAVITVLGCFLLISGKYSSTLILQGVGFLVTLLGLISLLFGYEFLKRLIGPVSYLIFMFSVFEQLLGDISPFLQKTTAWIATHLLVLVGMPVFLSGRFIALPHTTLEVAQVCNGVNHIVALVSLAIPLSFIIKSTIVKKFLFILFAFLIGVFANGLRVALIGIWTLHYPAQSIHGPFELFYVSFIIIFGMPFLAVLIFIGKRLGFIKWHSIKIENADSVLIPLYEKCTFFPIALAVIVLLLSIIFQYTYKPMPAYLEKPLKLFPKKIEQWQGQDVFETDWPIKHLTSDIHLKRKYYDNSKNEIGLYIGYYLEQNQKKEIINDDLKWLYEHAEEQNIVVGENSILIKKSLPNGNEDETFKGDERSFYFWYDFNQKIITNRYHAKLITFIDNFTKRKTNGAIIIVTINDQWASNQEADKKAIRFIQTVFPIIRSHLITTENSH